MGHVEISRRVAIRLLGALAGSVALPTTANEWSGLSWQTDYARAQHLRVSANRPMLVFVTTDSCPHCHKMLETTYADRGVAADVTETFVPTIVNGSQQIKLVQQFGIRIYPTTFVVDADNRVIDKIEGFLPPDKFRQRLAVASRRIAMRSSIGATR